MAIKTPVRHLGGGVVVDADGNQLLAINDWRIRDEVVFALNTPARDTARDDAIRAEERATVDLLIKRLDVLCDDLSGAAGSIRRGSGLAQAIRGDLLVRARASSSATQPEPAKEEQEPGAYAHGVRDYERS